MHVRTTAVTISLIIAALPIAGCSSDSNNDSKTASTTKPAKAVTTAAAKKVNCDDPNLSQSDWAANCGDGSTDLHKQFGQSFKWPDGVTVTVTEAKVFTNFNKEYGEHATAGSTDFRLKIRITNGGRVPLDLGKVSTITDGATNGGEATVGIWTDSGSPLEGRVAPGVTVTKTDDASLETKYGRKIVVTVQRMTDDLSAVFPEFSGSITD